jgi:lipopolysaccharide/colanic/teichoic acid biosynthesis glycosyltransferase
LAGESLEPLARQFGVRHDGRLWVLVNPRLPRSEWVYRLRDVVCSIAALVLLAPVFAVLAILVKLSSPGPVFYSTTVLGRSQQQFIWNKFRSMRFLEPDQDEAARREKFREFAEHKRKGKVIDNNRVTLLGRFMRKHSLDELPQIWNVLKGDMSLVGPRPCLPYEADLFPKWAARRFKVRPGLTGVWQVVGRSEASLEEGLMMDTYYVYARTLGFDFRITVETLRVLVEGKGGQ